MGRSIAIVGSGATELVFAFSLLARGHSVTLISESTPEQIVKGRLRLPGALFRAGQRLQRDLGIHFWDDEAYYGRQIAFDLRDDSGETVFGAVGRFHEGVAGIVDPRSEHSVWLDELERRGADVVYARPTLEDLDTLSALHDRVFVGGTGASLFELDADRSFPLLPSRTLAAVVVEQEWDRQEWLVSFVPGFGELAGMPILSTRGAEARAIFVRGVPGSPLDLAAYGSSDGPELLGAVGKVLARFLPAEAAALARSRLADEGSYLVTHATPIARAPIATLPSGRFVVSIGEAFVSLEPITGHSLTPSVRAASLLADAVSEAGSDALDESWARRATDRVFDVMRSAYDLEGSLLVRPPYFVDVLRAASRRADVADDLATACADPGGARWLYSPSSARARLGPTVSSERGPWLAAAG